MNCIHSDPTHGGDLIQGFNPVRSEDINLLDITNEGLFLDIMPANNRTKIMDRIVEEGTQLITKYDPITPDFEMVCANLKMRS